MYSITDWPAQAISYKRKNKRWAEDCVRYLSNNTVLNSSLIRKTVAHKKINYDLFCGRLNMKDLSYIVNPELQEGDVPITKIQHYPIINTKIMLLLGEERASQFDYRVIVTNPNAISEIENNKKEQLFQKLQSAVEDSSLNEQEYQQKLQQISDEFTYEWQDIRELRANCLLNHYWKELNIPEIFNDGYADALCNNEELYQCCIVAGEPTIRKLNPGKVRIYKSGYCNRVEDADMIVIEDYWSPGRILDNYYDQLTSKDVQKIESYQRRFTSTEEHNEDPRNWYIWGEKATQLQELGFNGDNGVWLSFIDGVTSTQLPYDIAGNIRVLQCYWKSLKKIKKVKRYNKETGNTEYEIFSENYIPNEDEGEEVVNLIINEAWQGTMIGAGEDAIFVDCRPCPVQFNTMSNPSKCHFGIVGSIYNFNDQQPYSIIDMMKPYNYLYDVVHDRLNRLLARNYGKVMQMNPTMIPEGWEIPKWLHYIKANGIAFVDPFQEAAKGKPAGSIQMSSMIDLETGNSIQFYLNMLEYLKEQVGDIVGITRQREGQIANRETVGGVERATLQSSHTTRWYTAKHDDTKKRVLECFLEVLKAAMRGGSKKIQYITPDGAQKIMEIDGDEFCESDYGLVVDNGYDMQQLQQDIKMVAQAEAQNGVLKFSTYLKLLQNCSLADKIHIIEQDELRMEQQQQQAQQQQEQIAQQQMQMQQQSEQMKMQHEMELNNLNNETKIVVAQINAESAQNITDMKLTAEAIADDGVGEISEAEKMKIEQQINEFAKKIELEKQKLSTTVALHEKDLEFKKQKLNKEISLKSKSLKNNKN